MFIDEATITVQAGDGGKGCISFRHEAHVPRGGPNGGDGGRGGSIYLLADVNIATLMDMAQRVTWKASDGRGGMGKKFHGRSGEDLVIHVPVGTIVRDADHGHVLRDMTEPGEKLCIAKGGRGGRGNTKFASSTDQTPRHAEPGTPGESRRIRLELKLMADVGLVGLPNAGKSTLLSRLSAAHPKIAAYPFTTRQPNLGIVECPGYFRFVMADIPGIIEGAHRGVGLGIEFLKHVERTRLIVHIVDAAPVEGTPGAVKAYRIIRKELNAYSAELAKLPEIIVANKLDLTDADKGVKQLKKSLKKTIIPISAVTGEGLDNLRRRIADALGRIPKAGE